MIYLDTHVVLWLYTGEIAKFTQTARELINQNDLYISPMVHLELQYLLETNRITDKPERIISNLTSQVGLQVDQSLFESVINVALPLSWTRDPFDRIIVANASLNNQVLVTKDRAILANYQLAKW